MNDTVRVFGFAKAAAAPVSFTRLDSVRSRTHSPGAEIHSPLPAWEKVPSELAAAASSRANVDLAMAGRHNGADPATSVPTTTSAALPTAKPVFASRWRRRRM